MKQANIEVFGPADPPPQKGEQVVAFLGDRGIGQWFYGTYLILSVPALDANGGGLWRWSDVVAWHRPVAPEAT
jgi:hypothetical protein